MPPGLMPRPYSLPIDVVLDQVVPGAIAVNPQRLDAFLWDSAVEIDSKGSFAGPAAFPDGQGSTKALMFEQHGVCETEFPIQDLLEDANVSILTESLQRRGQSFALHPSEPPER